MGYQSVFLKRLSSIIHRYPDRIAASDEERQITYGELEEESARVYHALKSEGIGREDCIQIVMKRGVSFFPCIIGILKAGACFVALEEGYPPERCEWISRDTGCVKVIDDRAYRQIIATADLLPPDRRNAEPMMPPIMFIHPVPQAIRRVSFMSTGILTSRLPASRKKRIIRNFRRDLCRPSIL